MHSIHLIVSFFHRYTIHDEQALEIFVIRMCEDLDLPPYSDKKVMNTVLEQFAVLAEAANVDAEKMEREWRAYLEQQSLIEAASLAAHLDRNFVPPPGLFDVIEQLSPRFWKGATRASQRRKRAASNLDVTRVVGRPSSGARSSSGAEDMDETAAEEEEPPQDPTVDQVDPTNLDEVAKVAHLLEKSEEQRMLMKVRTCTIFFLIYHCLTVPQIHISIGGIEYQDQFEWEITNPPSMIEAFAKITACDLGLPREFEVALVHEMHRQVFFHRVMMAKRKVLDEIASTKSPPNVCFLLPVTAESAIRNIAIASSYEPSLRATSNQINLPPLPPRA